MSQSHKTEYDKLFIGGKWAEPSSTDVIEVRCPATGDYVGRVPLAAAADVDAAVAAARRAFDTGPWPSTPPAERAAVIANALKLMEERKELFAALLAGETGQPPTTVETMHWMSSIGALNFSRARPSSRSSGKRSATAGTAKASSTASRSASSARSSRGMCRCSWPSTSWAPRCWPGARWC